MYQVRVQIMGMQLLLKLQTHHPIVVVMEEFSEFQVHQQVVQQQQIIHQCY